MPFTELTKKPIETKLKDYCERRIPVDAWDQLRLTYKIIGHKVYLIKMRPYPALSAETPIANIGLMKIPRNGHYFLLTVMTGGIFMT